MKKQIKELTFDERIEICRKHEDCARCPLKVIDFNGNGCCVNTVMNREVEIDE